MQFIRETQVPVLNDFCKALFDFMTVSLQKDQQQVAYCLQVLINVTYDSPNTSIYLMSCRGFVSTLISLIDDQIYTEDAVWLLIHVLNDGFYDMNKLHQATILELLAKKLSEGALSLSLTCLAAFQLTQKQTIVGVQQLVAAILVKLQQTSVDEDIDLAFSLLYDLNCKGLIEKAILPPIEQFLLTSSGAERQIRLSCAKLMVLTKQQLSDVNSIINLPMTNFKSQAMWCQLVGECLSLEHINTNKNLVLHCLTEWMNSSNPALRKQALLSLAHLQTKTAQIDFGLQPDDPNQRVLIQRYLRSLANTINCRGNSENLVFALQLAAFAYKITQWGQDLDQHLGSHILDLVESDLVFSHI